MSILDRILGFSSSSSPVFPHDPNDERAWSRTSGYRDTWGGHSGPSATGLYVRPDDALQVSCVLLGTRIIAETMGTNPLRWYRTSTDARYRRPLYSYPLANLLSADSGVRPNPWQSGAGLRVTLQSWATLWGLGLAEIVWGERPDLDTGYGMSLIPIDPDWISDIDQLPNYRVRYRIAEPGKAARILTQDQVFRLEGFGVHRLIPESILRRSREAVGVWLAQQQYRGTYFARGASPSIVFQHPTTMSDKALKRFKDSVQGRIGGLRNMHNVVVVEEGMQVKETSHTARNAQMIDAWEAQVLEIARYFGLPPHMFGIGKQPPYASREQATQEMVDFHFRPKAVFWQAAIKHDLIPDTDVVCEIDFDQLLTGSILDRAQADASDVMNGIRSENEVREERGLNPVPGLDEPRRSVNQDRGAEPRQGGNKGNGPNNGNGGNTDAETDEAQEQRPQVNARRMSALQAPQTPSSRDAEPFNDQADGDGGGGELREDRSTARTTTPIDGASEHHKLLARTSAARLVRREISSISTAAKRFDWTAPNAQSLWSSHLLDLYSSHAEIVAEGMQVAWEEAARYTSGHRQQVERDGVGVVSEDGWEKMAIEELVQLALGEPTK